MNSLKGFFYGIMTSVTFGLIPLFTLPLMAKGMHFESILFYRFIIATIALGCMMKIKGESFAVEKKDIWACFIQVQQCFSFGAMILWVQELQQHCISLILCLSL